MRAPRHTEAGARWTGQRRATVTVFLDSNLFIIDRFFRRDDAHPATHVFLARLADIEGVVPLMTLLELCGAASFRLSAPEADRWLHSRRELTVFALEKGAYSAGHVASTGRIPSAVLADLDAAVEDVFES